jgi:hypothetical protein
MIPAYIGMVIDASKRMKQHMMKQHMTRNINGLMASSARRELD